MMPWHMIVFGLLLFGIGVVQVSSPHLVIMAQIRWAWYIARSFHLPMDRSGQVFASPQEYLDSFRRDRSRAYRAALWNIRIGGWFALVMAVLLPLFYLFGE